MTLAKNVKTKVRGSSKLKEGRCVTARWCVGMNVGIVNVQSLFLPSSVLLCISFIFKTTLLWRKEVFILAITWLVCKRDEAALIIMFVSALVKLTRPWCALHPKRAIHGPLQRKTALWAIFTFSRKIDLKSWKKNPSAAARALLRRSDRSTKRWQETWEAFAVLCGFRSLCLLCR